MDRTERIPALWVVTPSHRVDASLAIAANRAGEMGILDLTCADTSAGKVLRELKTHVRSDQWGVRWNSTSESLPDSSILTSLSTGEPIPFLLLTNPDEGSPDWDELYGRYRPFAKHLVAEVVSVVEAKGAESAGFDGVLARGFESGGRVSLESSFSLLQRLGGELSIPYWVQGGLGPDTAAAALLAGSAGVVLSEQTWLATESPFTDGDRARFRGKSVETVTIGDGRTTYRFLGPIPEEIRSELDRIASSVSEWKNRLAELQAAGRLVAVGQDISLAERLADQHINTAGIIRAYRLRVQENFKIACRSETLAPTSPLAESLGVKYPIIQGAIAGITDEPAFVDLVESNGALPILSLGRIDAELARQKLNETRALMRERPWGAATAAISTDPEIRRRHIELLKVIRPPFAVLDGRQAEFASELEEVDVKTFLQIDSPELLEEVLAGGHRRIIVKGSECGGSVGARTSFALWQSAIDTLMSAKIGKPEEMHVIFAGPIHNALSAAMTAAAVAPLTARGMRVGVQIASAYMFTPGAVQSGIVSREFHETLLECQGISILQPGRDPSIRCATTPFVDEFAAVRRELIAQGLPSDEIGRELGRLASERLKLAAKGTLGGEKVDRETILSQGLFRVGELAVLRHQAVEVRDLHEEISQESVVLLQQLASERLPWHEEGRPAQAKSEDIAVVGMACMFPKAGSLREYWENICRSVDAVEEVSPERWRAEDFFDADRMARDRSYSKWGGFLGKRVFDPMKWRIPPAALKSIEPIQLLSLEVAAEAMADAGYDKREFPRERTGVIFACAGSHDLGSSYAFRTMMRHYLPKVEGLSDEARSKIEESLASQLPEWTEDSFPGFLLNVVAGRIARELNVNGPNYTVDAACAAALAAFHAAIEQLRSGTSDMVLVGGCDATNNPFCYMSFAKTHALSPRGHSRPFDESGDGIALGEGIGVMILKRLKDAERDGDKIYSVIKGIGSSSDGKNKSLTAPYPPGQIKAVERAYDDAEVCPTTVSLVEAHGTGTVVGDGAEITTLNEVFSSRTDEKQFAAVGSVKSMIGHTKTVAGMASMIKTVLALKHKVLPPTIGVETPTSRFNFSQSPFYINSETRPWIDDLGDHPRRAGVSAFGFGGTNFHVVLEEYQGNFVSDSEANLTPRSAELFVWKRNNRSAIQAVLSELQPRLLEMPERYFGEFAACLAGEEIVHDSESACRLAIVASGVEDLSKKLTKSLALLGEKSEFNDPTGIFYSESAPARPEEVCFLFPGQGSQNINMLRDLLVSSPSGQAIVSNANRRLRELLPKPLSRYIYPPPFFDEESKKAASAELTNTRVAQPALGVVELFAIDLLKQYNLHPAMTAGHSYGEHVALYSAGVIDRDDLIWLSAMRGQVCAQIAAESPGGMAAVQASAQATKEKADQLGLKIYLANMNAPDQTIIAGSEADVDQAVERLTASGMRAKRIPVSAPFHTPLLEAGAHAMAEHFKKTAFHTPKLPVYSNTTGNRHPDDPDRIRDLLARHFSEPVHWQEQVQKIHEDGARVFVEVGPGKVLTDLVSRILADKPITTLAIDVPGRDGWTQFGHAIARATVAGLPIDRRSWYANRGFAQGGLNAFWERMERQTKPKKSDWILGPQRAEPAVPPSKTESKREEEAKIVLSTERAVAEPEVDLVDSRRSQKISEMPVVASMPEVASVVPTVLPVGATEIHAPSRVTASGEPILSARTPSSNAPASRLGYRNGLRQLKRSSEPRSLKRSLPQRSESNGILSSQVSHEVLMTNQGSSHLPASFGGAELFMELQSSTRMMLEFQQSQQLLMERFLETQERLLSICLSGKPLAAMPVQTSLPAPSVASIAAPVAPYTNGQSHLAPVAAPAPVARTAPAPATAVRPPVSIPAAKAPAVAPPAPASAPAAKPAPAPVRAVAAPAEPAPAPVAVAPVAAQAGGPPPVEQFRKDLLAVISERTGYPEDMLDEELPLEAGLGIDSIKTVEVFSTLKQYHPFMRDADADEEETLAEFTRLKTIKDILDSYSRRIAKWNGGSPAASSNGAKNGVVERHSLTAADAPSAESARKKNSLAGT